MNTFKYKADSKELWLNVPEPERMPHGFNAIQLKDHYEKKWGEYNSRLHYTCSNELHELLKDRKDEIKENEFAVSFQIMYSNILGDWWYVKESEYKRSMEDYRRIIAIPLAEQTKPDAIDNMIEEQKKWRPEKKFSLQDMLFEAYSLGNKRIHTKNEVVLRDWFNDYDLPTLKQKHNINI